MNDLPDSGIAEPHSLVADTSRFARQLLIRLAGEILGAPVVPAHSLVAQGLDSLGAEELLAALDKHGIQVDYEHLLEDASIDTLAASLRTGAADGPVALQHDGLLPLTGPQRLWAALECLGWGDWAHISLCVSIPAERVHATLLPAMLQALYEANDALRLVLEPAPPGQVAERQRLLDGMTLPVHMEAAPLEAGAAMRMIEAFEGKPATPFAPSTRALVLAAEHRQGQHWLCLTMHHVFADRISMHSLTHQLVAMIAGGTWQVANAPPVGFRDCARWLQDASPPRAESAQTLARQLEGAETSLRRPRRRLAQAEALDLGSLPGQATLSPAESAALVALAQRAETTLPLLLHALFSLIEARLTGNTTSEEGPSELLVCHVVGNRERHPALREVVGCMDTSVPVAVRLRNDESLRSLCVRTRRAFTGALRAASELPRGAWFAVDAEPTAAAAGLIERIAHINVIRAPAAAGPNATALDVHPVRRVQRTRWGLLLRVTLPATGDEAAGIDLRALAEHPPLAIAVLHCLVGALRALLRDSADASTPEAAEQPVLALVDRVIERARFAVAQVRRAAALLPPQPAGDAFIYEQLLGRQQRWYAHDARRELQRDACNRFVGTAANPFPFTQLDKLAERRFLEDLRVPLPRLLHVLPRQDLRRSLEALRGELPASFVLKPAGAGHSFGVTLVHDGADLTRGGVPFDPAVTGTALEALAARGHCTHRGRRFAFNFSAFLIEEFVADANGDVTPTDYKIFVIGGRFLWLQLHFRHAGHTWVAFVDEQFSLLPHPAWNPTVCWRTHGALVCTDQVLVDARRPDCFKEMLEQARQLGAQLKLFVRLDWYADRARGPLLGELTIFPHILQPRDFYSAWANARVREAWQGTDGAGPDAVARERRAGRDTLARVQAALQDPAATLQELGGLPDETPWAVAPDMTVGQLRDYLVDFDLAPWGVSGDGRVGLLLDNGIGLAAALLATVQRHVAVPLAADTPAEALARQVDDSGLCALLVQAGSDAEQRAVAVASARPALEVIALECSGKAALAALPTPPAAAAPTPLRRADEVVLLLRTSGTSGAPRLVPFTLSRLAQAGASIAQALALDERDVGLSMLPLHHAGGIAGNLIAPLLAGTPMRFVHRFDPRAFFDALADSPAVTWCYLVPTQWAMVRDYARAHPRRCAERPWPGLRLLRSAGADLSHALAAELAALFGDGVSVLPTYGLTEAMPIAAPPLPYGLERPGSVGPVLPTVALEIVAAGDDGGLAPVAEGCVGEITVKGAGVLRAGELRDAPDAFTPAGFLRTGDLGRLASDGSGWLTVTGRCKDAINRGGETIAPLEVEALLAHFPGWPIGNAAFELMVLARPHPVLQEDIAVAVGAAGRATVPLAEFHAWTQAHLPSAMRPQTIVYLDELPRTPGGKLQRALLARRLGVQLGPATPGLLQAWRIESRESPPRLLEAWRVADADEAGASAITMDAVLTAVHAFTGPGLQLGPDTRFEDAGINSLAAMELAEHLNRRFATLLPPWVLSDYPTPRAMHGHLSQTAPARPVPAPAEPPALPARADARRPLRLLVLHGEAADAELMDLSLQATYWTAVLEGVVEFVFMEAPHRCRPKPEFHAAAVAAGLYGKSAYRSWGVTAVATLDASVASAEAALSTLGPIDAIGGICDGGLIAALVASRQPGLRLFLNLASNPLSRLPAGVRDLAIDCPSLHLISPQDEIVAFAELQEVPARCRQALVLQHAQGHAVPRLEGALQQEVTALLARVAPAAAQAPAGTGLTRPADGTWLEQALVRHPAVSECIVVESRRGLYAFVVFDQFVEHLPSSLRRDLEARMAAARRPDRLVPIDVIPRTPSGEVDLAALEQRVPPVPAQTVAPRNDAERQLAEIWQRLLLLDRRPGVDEDFFDLGGHSLLSVLLMREIASRFGRDLAPAELAGNRTIAALAARLCGAEGGDSGLAPGTVHRARASGLPLAVIQALLAQTAAWSGERASADALIFGQHTKGARAPLYWCFQGHHEFTQLARHLGDDQPLYGMRSGHEVMERSQANLERLGRYYADEIMALDPIGPYRIGGNCQSALVAFQMALAFRASGRQVALLCLQEQVVPHAWSGPVDLFFGRASARNPASWFRQPERNWMAFYDGPVTAHTIDGEHGRFFDEPNIRSLAVPLRDALDKSATARLDPRVEASAEPALAAVERNAGLRVPRRRRVALGAAELLVPVRVTNTSAATWPAGPDGPVQAAYWLHTQALALPISFGLGPVLPHALGPGQSIALSVPITIPMRAGRYRIEFDLCDNRVAWFRHAGSSVATMTLHVRRDVRAFARLRSRAARRRDGSGDHPLARLEG